MNKGGMLLIITNNNKLSDDGEITIVEETQVRDFIPKTEGTSLSINWGVT